MKNDNTLYLYGIIGDEWDECDEKTIARELNSMTGDITVKINSIGGDVFSGHTIKNLLKQYNGKKTIVVDGLAASAASYIAIGAADELRMAKGSMLMIHPASGICIGNAEDFRKEANLLDKLTEEIASEYEKSGKSKIEILEAMKNETWMNREDARTFGFNVIDDEKEASFETTSKTDLLKFNYRNMPQNIVDSIKNREITIRDVEQAMRNLGYSHNQAKAVASLGFKKASNSNQRDVEKEAAEMVELKKALTNCKFI